MLARGPFIPPSLAVSHTPRTEEKVLTQTLVKEDTGDSLQPLQAFGKQSKDTVKREHDTLPTRRFIFCVIFV